MKNKNHNISLYSSDYFLSSLTLIILSLTRNDENESNIEVPVIVENEYINVADKGNIIWEHKPIIPNEDFYFE